MERGHRQRPVGSNRVLLISAEAPLFVWVRHLQVCVTESLILKQCGRVFRSLVLGPLVLRIFGSVSG